MKNVLSGLLLMAVSFSTYAQNNKMTVFDQRYSENYQSVAFDGGWNDNFRNQALFFSGRFNRTYTAWIDTYGDIVVGYIDNDTKNVASFIVEDDKKQKIETCSISLLFIPDGKLMLLIADNSSVGTVRMYTMAEPENITKWDSQNIEISGNSSIESIQPIILSEQGNKIMAFAQLTSGELAVVSSDDRGKRWSNSRKVSLVKDTKNLKIVSDNKNKIAFVVNNETIALSDCNLSDSPQYISCPITSAQVSDIAFDQSGSVIVVSITDDNTTLYSRLGGKGWINSTLPIKNQIGDIVIDKETPSVLYYTVVVDSISEINKCTDLSGKGRWAVSPITLGTTRNNRSIVSVSNAKSSESVQICWIQETINDIKVNPLTSIKVDVFQPKIADIFKSDEIKRQMKKVADWQLTRSFVKSPKNDWQWGAFYMGLIAAYESTGDTRYWDELMNVGQLYNWKLPHDILHADRILASAIYLYLYEKNGKKNPEMIEYTKWAMELLSTRESSINPKFNNTDTRNEWWTWSDALFMAPPAFFKYSQVTGDNRAMDFANEHWIMTTYHLYSEADSLFYRDDRFFDKRSTNKRKVFWSRGNGWVAGAIPMILDMLPKDHKYRSFYEEQFKEIAAKLLKIQRPEGLWTVSLLDPEELLLGESSGSGFFGYALAWGVNNGLLDESVYGAAARKAWKALSSNVSEFGRLGYVQQVAGEPFPFFEDQSHTYASGAYLLFAKEMIKFDK